VNKTFQHIQPAWTGQKEPYNSLSVEIIELQ